MGLIRALLKIRLVEDNKNLVLTLSAYLEGRGTEFQIYSPQSDKKSLPAKVSEGDTQRLPC